MKFSWYSSPLTDLNAERDALRLDGDAPFALQIHRVEHLGLHFPRIEAAAFLNEPVCQSRFAVINMSNDGKIADILHRGLGWTNSAIIPVGDDTRGPYALPRGPIGRGRLIRRRRAAPESCVHNAASAAGSASTSSTSTPTRPAAGNAASSRAFPRKGRTQGVSTAEIACVTGAEARGHPRI